MKFFDYICLHNQKIISADLAPNRQMTKRAGWPSRQRGLLSSTKEAHMRVAEIAVLVAEYFYFV